MWVQGARVSRPFKAINKSLDRRVPFASFRFLMSDDNAESQGDEGTLISKRDDEDELCSRHITGCVVVARGHEYESMFRSFFFLLFAFLLTITDWDSRFSSGKEVPTRRVASGTALACRIGRV